MSQQEGSSVSNREVKVVEKLFKYVFKSLLNVSYMWSLSLFPVGPL